MARFKIKQNPVVATSSKKSTPFKTKNKFGREGCKRKKIRWRTPRTELQRRIAHCTKTYGYQLIKNPVNNVMSEASFSEVYRIKELIRKDLPGITVDKVMKVSNSYVAAMYELTKAEYQSRCKTKYYSSGSVRELQLFHSTRQNVVDLIVEDNLNWRKVYRCKFGIGNCFSSNADYANCHANRGNGTHRAFIVCKVLLCNKANGSGGVEIPPKGYDTTTNGSLVYVKYQDNECLPQYVAYYKCDMDKDVYGSKFNRRY